MLVLTLVLLKIVPLWYKAVNKITIPFSLEASESFYKNQKFYKYSSTL